MVFVYCLIWVKRGVFKGKGINFLLMRVIVRLCMNWNFNERLIIYMSLFLKFSGMKVSNFFWVECWFIVSCMILVFGLGFK